MGADFEEAPQVVEDVFNACAVYKTEALCSSTQTAFNANVHQMVRHGTKGSFIDLLAKVQALVLAQIIRVFSPDPQQRALAQRYSPVLRTWTRRLWEKAPSYLSAALSSWEAWLFGESVRRTIIMSHMLQDMHQMLVQGYFVHTLFMEALPFDSRSEMWDTDSWMEQDFVPLSSSSLVSYREYVDMWDTGLIDTNWRSDFEMMLVVGCKGLPAVKANCSSSHNLDALENSGYSIFAETSS